jgi:hypothetical protein
VQISSDANQYRNTDDQQTGELDSSIRSKPAPSTKLISTQFRTGQFAPRALAARPNQFSGWLYEGNAVLHPRDFEYHTQFVGITLAMALRLGLDYLIHVGQKSFFLLSAVPPSVEERQCRCGSIAGLTRRKMAVSLGAVFILSHWFCFRLSATPFT